MKLYLDDIRNPHQTYPNDSDWFVVRNYNEFVSAIEKHFSDLEIISFDNDLANFDSDGNEVTGYDSLKYLCSYIQDNNLDISNLRLNFHTANPVGKENMVYYWRNFQNYYVSIRRMANEMKYLNDVNYKDCVGKILKSKNSGDFKILKYNNKENVEIQFTNTGFKMAAQLTNIRNGKVKDPYSPSVFGVGIVGTKYPTYEGGVQTKEYTLWNGMLQRCYSDTYQKRYPTYKGCKCSENFLHYEYFYEWCQNQIGFGVDGNGNPFQLDKDLLTKGNKVYSENTSVFIPSEINTVLIKCTASRGEHLVGVCWSNTNKAFIAMVRKSKGKREYLGSFKTELEAFNAYKKAKESFIKEQANKWKDKIDIRAYNALMNYEVGIDD